MTHKPSTAESLIASLEILLRAAKGNGADKADAILLHSTDLQVACRKQLPEEIERSESAALGLRVWKGKKLAVVSSTDMNPTGLDELAQRAVSMASVATEDEYAKLAPKDRLATATPELDLIDGAGEPDPEDLLAQCQEVEQAALEMKGITNSEGASAYYGRVKVALATSDGFAGDYGYNSSSLGVSVVAGEGTGMERDHEYFSARYRADLPASATIGRKAAELTLNRMNPRKVSTVQVPVVFDPRVSRSLLGYFSSAVSGAAIARGTSFLKEMCDKQVFADTIEITDEPLRKRGLGSRPFDGEGVACETLALVEKGVLKSWLLDVRTAKKLGLKTTGHASRGVASSPSPSSTNLTLQAGSDSPEAMIADIKNGFYLTETFGMGVNLVTGDYSQGASGFWIENGKIAYPVSEITIAGHLKDMFATLVPANDLTYRYATNAPTILVPQMTVAGS